MKDPHARQKCEQLRAMLEDGLVMLHLDPRPDVVIVPMHLKSQPMLRLNLAWAFNLPALDIDEEGVYAVLSFNRANFGCTIPWSAVFAMTWPDLEHDGFVWPDAAPVELRAALAAAHPQAVTPATTVAAPDLDLAVASVQEPPQRPIFIVHEGGRAHEEPGAEPTETEPAERPKLRLVKG